MKAHTIVNETAQKIRKQGRLAASEGHEALASYLDEMATRIEKRAPIKCGMTNQDLAIERSNKGKF